MSWYRGKKVYITGGSSGIGKATALEAVRRGAHVWISARGQARLDEALAEIKAIAGADQRVGAIRVDISDQAAVQAASAEILAGLGGLDVLVNNAGVAFVDRIENASPNEYRQMMEINYFGMVWTTLAFLPHFRQQKGGSITAVSSTLGQMGLYGYSAYCASKFAIVGFMDCLRQDLLPYGVGVTILFPADVDTPQLAEENRTKPPETKALSGNASLARPEDVANTYLDAIERGRYHAAPGMANAAILWANRHLPSITRWVIDGDLRKFWKEKGYPAAT
jgi:NAD(P)-dependent dehydrogenase (short-subunit alcohol dehydrogenase family)